MTLPLELLRSMQVADPVTAWKAIFKYSWALLSAPLDAKMYESEVKRRDKAIANIDLFLATAGWELWKDWTKSVARTSTTLVDWWERQDSGRAVLILDGLSLREAPWILEGLQKRGYLVHDARATGAELPANTTPFAKALGFAQRSALGNDGAGSSHRLVGARTETLDVNWEDAASQITSQSRWVLWHHWPDTCIHEMAEQGKGLSELVAEVADRLTSESFWEMIFRLTQGRRLVITSDHGYAASGMFPDITAKEQANYMKSNFKAGRSVSDSGIQSSWVPPVDLVIDTDSGPQRFVLGRRKWKVSGGYPTLTHGGLTILETMVPFIEVSRAEV